MPKMVIKFEIDDLNISRNGECLKIIQLVQEGNPIFKR